MILGWPLSQHGDDLLDDLNVIDTQPNVVLRSTSLTLFNIFFDTLLFQSMSLSLRINIVTSIYFISSPQPSVRCREP
jgi:hypothetical protein